MVKTVYLALGSNLGDRAQNIASAIGVLARHGIRVSKQSALYETEPVNVRGGGWFLNAAVEARTELMPRQVMSALLAIERSLGRRRASGDQAATGAEDIPLLKEPRVIDLDILLFGSSVIKTGELQIPHPRMAERRFVLTPLAEIAADVEHPLLRQTIGQLLAATRDRSQVRRWLSEGG